MRLARILPTIFIALMTLVASAQDMGSISGVIRDGEGKPLAGVAVTLASGDRPAKQATSGQAGYFVFSDLPSGDYTLKADLTGFAVAKSSVVRISSSSQDVTADLKLIRISSPNAPSSTHSPLQFQASGIHGLIDPGGYSASANADAASGLLRGMADVKRANRSFGLSSTDAKNWPCDIEPQLQKDVERNPGQEEARRKLGQFYVLHDQPAKAIPLLKQAFDTDAKDEAASKFLGIAWLQSGQFDEARRQFNALSESHDQPEIHQLLARADEGSGMFQQAAREYQIADKQQPSEESLFGAGYELILAGTPADAVPVFQAGLRRYPQSIPLRIGIGTAQFLVGHSSEAVHTLLDAADSDPADPRPYPFLAAASGLSADEHDRVRESFKRFAIREPGNATANYLYAVVLSRDTANADNSAIEALLKRAIRLDPSLAKAHLKLADLYAQRNDDADAIPEYHAAIRLAPEMSEAHYRLAKASKRIGHADESVREMQIFQQQKAKPSSDDGIDIAQFISVMDAPSQHAGAELQCPARQPD